jgi:hypothetical protein
MRNAKPKDQVGQGPKHLSRLIAVPIPILSQAALDRSLLTSDKLNPETTRACSSSQKVGVFNGVDLPVLDWKFRPLVIMCVLFVAFSLGWLAGADTYSFPDARREGPRRTGDIIDVIVDRIIQVESNDDPNAKNKRSTATGLGQFLNETWLEMIRVHRPDLRGGRSLDEILELRRDPRVAREITVRYLERNATILKKRGMPVTAGTLYLAHFAGPAGAVAILSAQENADAALVIASADTTGQTKRETLVKANPFLARFTAADLRSWAARKMGVPEL